MTNVTKTKAAAADKANKPAGTSVDVIKLLLDGNYISVEQVKYAKRVQSK